MRFIITGKIKPAVRMTQRGTYVSKAAQEYLACKADIGWQLKAQMGQNGWTMLPTQTALVVSIIFWIPRRMHCCDIDNQVKTVLDSAQGIVFKDDRWVDVLYVHRKCYDEYKTQMNVREYG